MPRKSRTRSGARRVKPPEPFTWFIDRSLGRRLVTELRSAGFLVEEHADHFAPDAPDAEWLGEAGRRGWVVLTKDKAVRRNALELAAIRESGVACFSLGRGDLKAEQMVVAFVAARPRMEKALRRFELPMTASVTASGHVSVLLVEGEVLQQPKSIK
jgi:predicted nuclease of predicted toxin-antitoxin system